MSTKKDAKITVLISYNEVKGFSSGWHANKRLYVCANDAGRGRDTGKGNSDEEKAGSVMHDISGSYYHGNVPVKKIERYYVYAGLNAMDQALSMAESLRRTSSAPVTVVACHCRSGEKERLLSGNGIDIIWSECGGKDTMGELAKEILKKAS